MNRIKKISIIFLLSISAVLYYFFNDLAINNKSNIELTGLDISHHNGELDWSIVSKKNNFIIIKATEGKSYTDNKFISNWKAAKSQHLICGAYHFFSPDVSAELQFDHFRRTVHLAEGDLPPILDVENRKCDFTEVNKWLKLAKDYYGVEPILYTDYLFFKVFLEWQVKNCKLWIYVNDKYGLKPSFNNFECLFWQYKQEAVVDGYKNRVDLNRFLGSEDDFKKLLIR